MNKKLIIAMVRTGEKYSPEYVFNLVKALKLFLPADINYRFVCITDQKEHFKGVENIYTRFIPIEGAGGESKLIYGWWAKLFLFNRSLTGTEPILYFDLDTVLVGDLRKLVDICFSKNKFLICRNFTQLAGNKTWPCKYGSCIMFIPSGWGNFIWQSFINRGIKKNIDNNPKGDQQYIQSVFPCADYFQDCLPKNYIIGRRQFTEIKPKDAAIMVFAGSHKPDNTPIKWLKQQWQNPRRIDYD